MRIHLSLIGMGAGHPDHLTRQGEAALRRAQLVLVPRKGADKADLADLRLALCQALLPPGGAVVAPFDMPVRKGAETDYRGAVDRWHDAIAQVWLDTIAHHLPDGGEVALLVWGDPSLYDSTLRIAARLQPAPVSVQVVAGITSVQALAAAHGVALNDIGQPFVVTTGRQLRDHGWPAGVDTAVVMLDGQCSFQHLPADGVHIWWGAYLGMPQQVLDSGPLAEAGPRIEKTRAQARARHGWIMDIYLLRREPTART